ncbi:MAG: hypothetical protein VW709_04280, partial [Rickettsiales bacterium]
MISISVEPGLVKTWSTPAATRLRTRLSAPFVEGEAGAGLRLHEGAGALAEALVRHGDDGAGFDRGMAVEQVLDLDDGNVLAAADDDVLGAADDADIAVGIHAREVAGLEPAVVFLVGVGPFQIAHEHADAARLQAALGIGRH